MASIHIRVDTKGGELRQSIVDTGLIDGEFANSLYSN